MQEGLPLPDDTRRGEGNYVTQAELRAVQGSVESQIGSVAKSVSQLTEIFKSDRDIRAREAKELRDAVDHMGEAFRDDLSREREARRTPLAAIIGGIALFISFLGMTATLIVFAINGETRPLDQVQGFLIEETKRQREKEVDRSHWQGSMEERIDHLETHVYDGLPVE